MHAEEKFYKVYTRYLQIWGMKGKYCSVYNIKIKRYTTVVRYLSWPEMKDNMADKHAR
jgi:hypothetical protein